MKTKHIFIICFLLVLKFSVYSQEYATDKGAVIISGMVSFSSQGGDLFVDRNDNRATVITLSPTVNYFVFRNFFIGAGVELTDNSQGDKIYNSFGIGPQIGLTFGSTDSQVLPYLDVGIRYIESSIKYTGDINVKESGSDIFLGAGLIVPINEYIGLTFEGGYHMMHLTNKAEKESASGNIFTLAIGIAGLFY